MQVLCNALVTDGDYVAMATSCCHTILKSNTLSRSLTTKYDALVSLLNPIHSKDEPIIDTIFHVMFSSPSYSAHREVHRVLL